MRTLHMAAAVGNLDIVQFLVSVGISVNDAEDGHLPLHEAIMNTRVNVCRYLIEEGADVNATKPGDETMLHHAVDYSTNIEIAETLISAGASVNQADFVGSTPLHRAVRCNWPDMMKLLCTHGADPEAKDADGETPLHVAAKQGSISRAQFLIFDQNVSLDVITNKGATPYAFAVKYAHSEVADLLVAAGYRPVLKDCSCVEDFDEHDHRLRNRDQEKFNKLFEMTKSLVSIVPSLQDISTFKVRRLLGRDVNTAVNSLQIPGIMRDKITLKRLQESFS